MASPVLVILGASGDLTSRLVVPALYRLETMGKLPDLDIVGYALEDWTDRKLRDHLKERASEVMDVSDDVWGRFASRLSYLPGNLDGAKLEALRKRVEGPAVFYLALPPGMFAEAGSGLADVGLADEKDGWRRLVVEKPFGTDLASAKALNAQLHRSWREEQVFRMDHFLGKETVQNILVFRFANRFLEPALHAAHVESVQITAAETLGLEGRYRYYDGIGALRDMIQSHLIQLFTFVAMEPLSIWDSEILRDHVAEVLRSVRPISPDEVARFAVRGQYGKGRLGGREVPAYRDEPHIGDESTTETYAALRLQVDNWRWKGVPFYLRSGKRMARTMSEVAVTFRAPPTRTFRETSLARPAQNELVFRMKPQESINLVAQAKRPGLELEAQPVTLHAPYARDGENEASAYEQLLLDVLEGSHGPFLRFDAVEEAWRIVMPVLEAWKKGEPEPYSAGSEGPKGQDHLLEPGDAWRPLSSEA